MASRQLRSLNGTVWPSTEAYPDRLRFGVINPTSPTRLDVEDVGHAPVVIVEPLRNGWQPMVSLHSTRLVRSLLAESNHPVASSSGPSYRQPRVGAQSPRSLVSLPRCLMTTCYLFPNESPYRGARRVAAGLTPVRDLAYFDLSSRGSRRCVQPHSKCQALTCDRSKSEPCACVAQRNLVADVAHFCSGISRVREQPE
jgi:hypothetical protein